MVFRPHDDEGSPPRVLVKVITKHQTRQGREHVQHLALSIAANHVLHEAPVGGDANDDVRRLRRATTARRFDLPDPEKRDRRSAIMRCKKPKTADDGNAALYGSQATADLHATGRSR